MPELFHLQDALNESPSGRSFQFLAESISPHTVPIQVAWHDVIHRVQLLSDDQKNRLQDISATEGGYV